MYKAAAKDETSPTTPPPIDKMIEFFVKLFLFKILIMFSNKFKSLFCFPPATGRVKNLFFQRF